LNPLASIARTVGSTNGEWSMTHEGCHSGNFHHAKLNAPANTIVTPPHQISRTPCRRDCA
jgi:hypothetical protein